MGKLRIYAAFTIAIDDIISNMQTVWPKMFYNQGD